MGTFSLGRADFGCFLDLQAGLPPTCSDGGLAKCWSGCSPMAQLARIWTCSRWASSSVQTDALTQVVWSSYILLSSIYMLVKSDDRRWPLSWATARSASGPWQSACWAPRCPSPTRCAARSCALCVRRHAHLRQHAQHRQHALLAACVGGERCSRIDSPVDAVGLRRRAMQHGVVCVALCPSKFVVTCIMCR